MMMGGCGEGDAGELEVLHMERVRMWLGSLKGGKMEV